MHLIRNLQIVFRRPVIFNWELQIRWRSTRVKNIKQEMRKLPFKKKNAHTFKENISFSSEFPSRCLKSSLDVLTVKSQFVVEVYIFLITSLVLFSFDVIYTRVNLSLYVPLCLCCFFHANVISLMSSDCLCRPGKCQWSRISNREHSTVKFSR